MCDVPALRFPEFCGEWKEVKLSKVIKVQGGYAFKSELFQQSGVPIIRISNLPQNELFVNLNDCVYYSEGNYHNFEVHKGDLLIAMSGATTGKTAIYNNNSIAYLNQRVGCFKVKSDLFYSFLYALVETKSFKNQLNKKLIAGAQPNISSFDIESIKVTIPGLIEQQKIAKLIGLLNERIDTQNKIIEDLKKLKSAIVEALFCAPKESVPAKRLSPYSKDWKLVKLFDICQRIQTKNTGRQCRQVLTIAAQYGLVNQEDFFNKTVASENLERYYLLQKGDFAYNKSYSGDYTWGAIKRLERYDKGVLSPLYICFRPDSSKVDADFLAHYFESKKWYKGVADIAGEGARNHGLLNISVIDFFNTTHRIPNIDEQKRIAKILNSLSLKLSCEQRIMQSLVMQRNYLLRNMFI